MLIIPAVDIKEGNAVRLKQGRAEEKTVYGDDPVAAARRWAEGGAKRIHIVDLDGAFEGAPRNLAHTLAILKAFAATHEIEIGGGLRTVETVAQLIDAGAARCVIGTKALDDRTFLDALARRFPGRINVGIDAKDGFVVTRGWVNVSQVLATQLVGDLAALPLGEIIYTDIARDGMLQGPNLSRLAEMRAASTFPIIASGGVTTIEDIRDCKALNCFGAIIGKALYDGPLTLAEALAA
jgi:phosphoribosylformimino-5-aminoimidazole carboxamide ribotide isomerase